MLTKRDKNNLMQKKMPQAMSHNLTWKEGTVFFTGY